MEVRRKCDPELGRKVNEHLLSLGLETPMSRVRDEFNSEEAIEKIPNNVKILCLN